MNSTNGSHLRRISFPDIVRAPSGLDYDEPFETIISDAEDVEVGDYTQFESQIFAVTNQELEWEFPKQVRLHLVDSERNHFLKCLNTSLLRKLVTTQAITTALVVISQVGIYAFLSTPSYRIMGSSRIGLWGPILFYTPACWLTHINTSDPSGCSVGFAMGFQILSIFVGILSVFLTPFELHFNDARFLQMGLPVTGLICFFVVVLGSLCMTITSTFVTGLYCRATCCVKSKMRGDKVFALDVETVNIQS